MSADREAVAGTIAAIATAPGEAGVGIVRVSGPAALHAARTLFRLPQGLVDPTPRRVYAGWVVRAATEERLDDCLLTWFRAPSSYTGEDVVEFACHGSNLVLARLLGDLASLGIRPAEPGEFTRRAFLNGKMDLAAAEGVMDLLRARTDAALRVAAGQLEGRLSREIRALRGELIAILAEIEAGIDFPEEIDPPTDPEVARRAAATRERALALLATADAGRLYREGAALVLVGRPNVGKSSLLNALLREERAIVTPVPGTTRDFLEESLSLRGVPIRAIDTAGLHETEDAVEALGVERTRAMIHRADLVLWLVDASQPETEDDRAIERLLLGHRTLKVANKIDQPCHARAPAPEAAEVRVSALTGAGLDALEEAVAQALAQPGVYPESVLVSNIRHQARLVATVTALDRAVAGATAGFDQAAVALDLRQAAEALGEITGETVTEDTITEIFARFCVGK